MFRSVTVCFLLCLCVGYFGAADEEIPNPSGRPAIASDFKPRLPNYFAAVVTSDQRQRIYSIQLTYNAKIVSLERQIIQLEDAQAKEIDAVLTAEQLVAVNAKRAAAKKLRSQKRP